MQADSGKFQHNLQEALRLSVLREISHRRVSFADAGRGVNRKWSCRFFNRAQGNLRWHAKLVMTGAVETQSHKHQRDGSIPEECPFCEFGLPETTDHMNWSCPAWDPIRDAMPIPHSETDLMHLPSCFLEHGLVTEDMLQQGEPACEEDEEMIVAVQEMLASIAQARFDAEERLKTQAAIDEATQLARGALRPGERKRRRLTVV